MATVAITANVGSSILGLSSQLEEEASSSMREQWSSSVDTCVPSVPLRRLLGGECSGAGSLRDEQGGRGGGRHGGGKDCGYVQLTLQALCTMVARLLMTSEMPATELKSQVSPPICWWWLAIPVTSAMLGLVSHMVALVATCAVCWPLQACGNTNQQFGQVWLSVLKLQGALHDRRNRLSQPGLNRLMSKWSTSRALDQW